MRVETARCRNPSLLIIHLKSKRQWAIDRDRVLLVEGKPVLDNHTTLQGLL